MFAATMQKYINQLEWKPEELISRDSWVKLTDTTLRLDHFCPWLIKIIPPRELIDEVKDALNKKKGPPKNKKEETKREEEAFEKARDFSAEDLIMEFRRTLARGMIWTGSYLAQPKSERLFTSGTLSETDVYGESFVGIKFQPGILEAIEASGYLDAENMKKLREEIWEFNFQMKGRKGR